METFEARRHAFRLGVVFVAGAALLTAFTTIAVADGERSPWWLVIAVMLEALTGVGLMFGSRVAGAFAALQLIVAGAGGLFSTISDLAAAGMSASALTLGNALASTTIIVWLCAIAVVGLLAPQRRTTWLTIRVLGACLAVIAASHVVLATIVGFSAPLGSVSISLQLTGTTVWGFPGWPLWHAALAATSLVMALAPRSLLPRACSVLFALFAILAPLTLISLLASGLPGIQAVLMLLVWSCLLFPLYLLWWLRDNAG